MGEHCLPLPYYRVAPACDCLTGLPRVAQRRQLSASWSPSVVVELGSPSVVVELEPPLIVSTDRNLRYPTSKTSAVADRPSPTTAPAIRRRTASRWASLFAGLTTDTASR